MPDGDELDVTVPSWRSTKDVESAEDLIEEVVRLYGFEEIESELPTLPVTPPTVNKLRRQDWAIRENFPHKDSWKCITLPLLPSLIQNG
ncbi:hypothetical protein HC823_02065 [Candidatus Gracilibacteria bacterium]|nr:hypothetical protein [Candidatus Gracilibacteria bacterium]